MQFILSPGAVTVFLDGKPYTVGRTARTFDAVVDAIRSEAVDKLRQLLDIRSAILKQFKSASGKVTVDGNRLMYGDQEVTGLISTRVFEMLAKSLDIKPMITFVENMMENPSMRATRELYGFMEACNLPITEDGHFLAYKRVRGDYKSVHDGKTDNSIGRVLEMPRNKVDEDAERTCSYGLHFCSFDYLKHFSGERIVILKIHPRDVVAIPTDYNNSKGRACRYEVVAELNVDHDTNLPTKTLDENFTTDYGHEADESINVVNQELTVALDTALSPSGMTLRKLRAIRDWLTNGTTYAEIAKDYGISPRQVGRIDRGEAWANVK